MNIFFLSITMICFFSNLVFSAPTEPTLLTQCSQTQILSKHFGCIPIQSYTINCRKYEQINNTKQCDCKVPIIQQIDYININQTHQQYNIHNFCPYENQFQLIQNCQLYIQAYIMLFYNENQSKFTFVNTCEQCKDNQNNTKTTLCKDISLDNCKQSYQSEVVLQNGDIGCIDYQRIHFCEVYEQIKPQISCYKCKKGFEKVSYEDGTSHCQILIQGCKQYLKNDIRFCSQCEQGYQLNENNRSCINKSDILTIILNNQPSQIIQSSTPIQPSQTNPTSQKQCPVNTSQFSYIKNSSGQCIKLDINCVLNQSDGKCIKCKQDYYLLSGKCYKDNVKV